MGGVWGARLRTSLGRRPSGATVAMAAAEQEVVVVQEEEEEEVGAAREAEKAGVIAPVGLSLSALQIKQACVYAFYFLLGLEILFPLVGWTGWHGALLEWLLTVNVMVWVMSLSLDFKQAQLYAAFVEPQSPSAPTKVAPAHK